jgi:hypothetical protein
MLNHEIHERHEPIFLGAQLAVPLHVIDRVFLSFVGGSIYFATGYWISVMVFGSLCEPS